MPNLKFKKSLMFKELPIPKKFQSEKISPVCKNPASLRADWRGTNKASNQLATLYELLAATYILLQQPEILSHGFVTSTLQRGKKTPPAIQTDGESCSFNYKPTISKSASTTPWGSAVLWWRWRCQWPCSMKKKISKSSRRNKKTSPAFQNSSTNRQAVLGWRHFPTTVNIACLWNI